jgi:hypothetical protein
MAFDAGAVEARMRLALDEWKASIESVKADEKTLTGSAKNIDAAFTAMGTQMAITGGVMVAAVVGITQKTAVAEEKMGDLAKSLGMGIEKLTALKLTAELGMISLEEMGGSLGILNRNMADAVSGSVQAQDKFGLLGIATKDLTDGKGGLKDTDQVLMIIADRFKLMPDGPAKVAAAMELMGRGGKAMIPVLNDGSEAIKQQMERTRELGGVMTKDGIRSAEDYVRAQKELGISMDATTRTLGQALMPLITDFMKKATDIATAVRNWAKEHPALAKTVMETALGLGSMLVGMGGALLMLPQLLKGLEAMKTVAGAGGVGGALTKIGAVAATAFVGWQIGRAVGELTGLDEWLQKVYDKAFKLLGIIKEHNVEYGTGHAAAYATQQETIGKAFDLTGKHAKTYHEALDLLVEVYKKNKTTGSEALDALVKAHGTANEAVEKHTIKIINNKEALEAAKKAQEEWAAFLSSVGIQSQEDMSKAHEFCRKAVSYLEDQYKTGKIGILEYTEAHKKLNEKMWETGTALATALPPSRNMHDVWDKMPKVIGSANYAFGTLDDKLDAVAHEMGISTTTLKAYIYELQRLQLGILGFHLPPFPGWPKEEIKTAVTNPVSEAFAGLYNNIAQGFGDTFQKFVETWSVDKLLKLDIDFKAFFKDLWGNIKESFFTMIGELTTKWVKGFLENILVKKTSEAAANAATSMTSMATTTGSALSGLGTLVAGIASTIATVITTLATGIATALVTLATAVATAATILAAAAVPLLIVGAIAIAIFAGFKAIESLFGGGGGKQTDVTYWLKLMWADGKELHDWIINLPAAYFNTWHNFFFGTEWATRETVNVLYAIKDFLGPMLGALQSIDSQISKLRGAASGAISTQTEMLVVHGTPSIPEVTLPMPGLQRLVREGGGSGGTVMFNAQFNVSTLDADSFRETVRRKIGPEIVEWIRTNVGKRLIADALGV